MRVCVDARTIREIETGIGRYARELVRAMARLNTSDEFVIVKRDIVKEPIVVQDNFREVTFSYEIASLHNMLAFQRYLNREKFDVYHSLHNFLPLGLARKTKAAITSHDWLWLTNPELTQVNKLRTLVVGSFAKYFQTYSVKRADKIICISRTVEEEYERLVSEGLSKRPTAVIHHGINSQGFDGESSESLKRWAEKRFILAVSSTRPTKNIRRLLQALAELHKVAPDVLLLIAGRGDMKAELMQQATELGVADSLHFLGMLTDPELGYLYRHAQVLAYPSIAEGFGFPIVEAYSQGCPVMCSNVSSPAELGQGAAHFVDPLSVKSIADGLIKIILDREYRQTLAEASRKRVLDFHWDRAGQKTLEVYRAMA